MDTEVFDAVTIVDISSDQAEEWFTLVRDAHSVSDDDWTTFQETLTAAATGDFGVAAETFLRYVADHGRIELIGRLVADFSALSSSYADAMARPATAAPDSLWSAAVAEFGAGWAGWDGSEARWAEFRDWFYSATNSHGPDMYAAAYERLDPLNGEPLAERAATLAEFGFTISAPSNPLARILDESLEQALAAVPGSKALSAERLARIRAEIIEELAQDATR